MCIRIMYLSAYVDLLILHTYILLLLLLLLLHIHIYTLYIGLYFGLDVYSIMINEAIQLRRLYLFLK